MKKGKLNKKIFLFCFLFISIIVGLVINKDIVNAAGVKITYGNETTYVCYDRSTGAYKETFTGSGNHTKCTNKGYGYTILKLINNDYAYCANWKLKYYTDANYIKDTTWSYNSANAIKAGYLINEIQKVNSKSYNSNKAYERAGAALNTLFAKNGDSGSYKFSDTELNGHLSSANSYYNSVKLTKKLPSLTITVKGNDKVLGYNNSSKKYFSGLVTISGFVANYGGSSDSVTYTVSAKTSDGTSVSLCTGIKGTGCQTGEIPLSKRSTNYSFYVFVDKDKVEAGDDITITVTGSNSSTYYTSVVYKDTAHSNAQKLITLDKFTVSRSTKQNETLTVPDLDNHRITIYKVDENGQRLSGATLSLYRDSITGTPIKTNNGASSFYYSTGDVSVNKDDFFEHSYYLVETSAPDGYVYANSSTPFYEKGKLNANSSNVTLCYKNDSDEAVDNEFCNFDNYYYMCKTNTGTYEKPDEETGNCETNITVDPDGTNTGDVSTEGTEGNDNTVSPNGLVDGTNNPLGSVIYTKVCYSQKDNSEVGDEYCSEKTAYTKVQYYDGNMVVHQPNSRNVINISKIDITSEKEILGASLKICTKGDYESKKNDCTPAKTIDDIEMSWTSGELAHSIYGVPKGNYYIVETIPPKGYLITTTATAFSIDGAGKVVTEDKEITNEEFVNGASIAIKNKITEITISKLDIATSKELPGATISICRTYEENGEIKMLVDQYTGDCIEATLYNGKAATWKSTDEPYVIRGLRADRTYYLVERIAPTDYSTAESILFTLNSDGTLSDANGNKLTDNKLVMYDEPLEDQKTGSLTTYIVVGILIGVAVLGGGCVIYLKTVGNKKLKR